MEEGVLVTDAGEVIVPPGVLLPAGAATAGVAVGELGLPRYISAILFSCSRRSLVRVSVHSACWSCTRCVGTSTGHVVCTLVRLLGWLCVMTVLQATGRLRQPSTWALTNISLSTNGQLSLRSAQA